MTMTTSQDTMTDAARRGQEAITHALQIWADAIQKFVPTSDPKLRGAVDVVDNMFDFAEQVLVTQRELAKSWLVATTSAATQVGSAAQSATKDMTKGMQDVAQDVAQDMPAPTRTTAKKS